MTRDEARQKIEEIVSNAPAQAASPAGGPFGP